MMRRARTFEVVVKRSWRVDRKRRERPDDCARTLPLFSIGSKSAWRLPPRVYQRGNLRISEQQHKNGLLEIRISAVNQPGRLLMMLTHNRDRGARPWSISGIGDYPTRGEAMAMAIASVRQIIGGA